LVIRILALPNVALPNVALPNVVIQTAVIQSVVIQSVVIQTAVIQSVAIQTAVIQSVALILALHAVRDVAVIQVAIPARDAQRADFREEFHAAVPSLARACWQERSRSFPVVAHVFPIHPHGRGLGVAEAQAVL
jgi:hypothetical protein